MTHEQQEMFDTMPKEHLECLNIMRQELIKNNWLKIAHFTENFGWTARKTKSIASISKGEILSSDKGYKLTAKATLHECNHSYNRLTAQASAIQQRAEGIRKFSHQAIG